MALVEEDGDPNQADVITLLDRYDNQYDRLVGLLSGMLARREQWMPHLLRHRQGDNFDRNALEDSLRYLVESQLALVGELLPAELNTALTPLLHFIVEQLGDAGKAQNALLEAGSAFHGQPLALPTDAKNLPHWQTLAKLLTTDKGQWRSRFDSRDGFPAQGATSNPAEKEIFQSMKDRMTNLVDGLRDNEDLRRELAMVRLLPNPRYEDEAWDSLQAMMRLLQRCAQEWQVLIAETGEADFTEISGRAIDALGQEGEPSPLALRIDYRIRHLLVDEFQDTSHSQINLLQRLTEGWSAGDGRTLFLVGDPMQSIYRFRKAEVSLFMQAFNGELFQQVALQPLILSVNFRSTRPVVDWVNRVFPDVMPKHDDPVMGAVVYSASDARPGATDEGGVQTHFTLGTDPEEEARAIVDVISATPAERSIAVLVRSRAHARGLLTRLDRLREEDPRFRYQAVELNPLAEAQHIFDLVSLTLALVQGADRLAWLSLLRSPLIGMALADLDALFGGDWNRLIGTIVSGEPPTNPAGGAAVSAEGRQRLQRVAPILGRALEQSGRVAIRELVETTWLHLGGPACALNDSEIKDARTYFALLESLENEGLPIDRDSITARLENLYAEPDAGAEGNLQIMTIHKAKGLQFDTVILPGLNRGSGTPENRLLHWFEIAEQDRIVFSPMRNAEEKEQNRKAGDLIKFISSIENRREAFEASRLLYVAATRAERKLHLFASLNPNARKQIQPRASTPLAHLWPSLESTELPALADRLESFESAEESEAALPPAIPQQFRRLPSSWQLPPPPPAIESARWQDPAPNELIPFEWAQQDARITGELVHRLLQETASMGIEDWNASGGAEARKSWCLQQLRSQGLDEERGERIARKATAALDRCLQSERGRWMLQNHAEAKSEYPITAILDGVPRNLVLDRTFVDKNERWIIDYKTSDHSGGGLESFLESEEERYRDQLMQYRDAMALAESRPIRCALYFPLLDEFRLVAMEDDK